MQAESKRNVATSPTSAPRRQLRIPLRLLFFLFAALLLLISSLLAFNQSPRANPLKQLEPLSLDWWRSPLERNAFKRLPVVAANLNDIFALPGSELLWAVGNGGMILHSPDGGQTWERQNLSRDQSAAATPAALGLISSAFAAEAPAVSKEQYLLEQKQQKPAAPLNLRVIDPDARSTPNPVQQQSTIPPKPDFPPRPADPTTATLNAVYFVNRNYGWTVSSAGLILRTRDGGKNWESYDTRRNAAFNDVFFLDAKQGWIAGPGGAILQTTDGGDSWRWISTNTVSRLKSIHFHSPEFGWAVGDSGTVRLTKDAGRSWRSANVASGNWLENVFFVSPERGWAVGNGGTILSSEDGGASWQAQNSGTDANLYQLYFSDTNQGWAVGFGGIVVYTDDGGNNWRQQSSGSQAILSGVQFADNNRGWLAGSQGTLLKTVNGGRSWYPLSRSVDSDQDSALYSRYPAPWYYLSWLLAGLLLLPAVRQPQQIILERRSVADMLVSDKPLEAGDPDPLNFGLVARALSRYLRNENTQPPLTIAITGEWGTGKSSLMNLLKADLKHYGVRPVWFNAWHHQKESNLLASLLDNIRNQSVPSWWCFSGLNFRLRLLLVRGWRNCLPVLFVLFVFALSLGVVCHYPGDLRNIEWQRLLTTSVSLSDTANALLEKFPFLTLWASTLTLLVAVFKGFVAFGIDPKKLIPTIPGRLRIQNLNVELSFRQKFAREFKDVTKALQPRTMLILIDDLDRCQAEHVLEILETINYLVSSGECYVVLGMARERVERCIGAAFKEVAEDMIDDQVGEQPLDNGRKKRVEFARQYLEKLINIEVPVPVATPGQTQLLLAPQLPSAQPPSRWVQSLAILAATGNRLIPWGLLLVVLLGGFWLGKQSIEGAGQVKVAANGKAVSTTGRTERMIADQVVIPSSPDEVSDTPASYVPGETASFPKSLLLYPLLALAAGGVVLLVRRPEYKVQDSLEFAKALQVWHPLIVAKRNTPRSLKRFLNRVRYFAMINRDKLEFGAQRWGGLSAQSTPPSADKPLNLDEATLVALGALHHVHPQLIKDDQLFQLLSSHTLISAESLKDLGRAKDLAATIRDALKEHEKIFGSWSCSKNERALFLEISQGIQII